MPITKYKGLETESPELVAAIQKAQERGGGNRVDWKLDIVRQADLPAGSTKNPKPTRMRILPPAEGMLYPWVSWRQHFLFVKAAGKKLPFNCLRLSNGTCPACMAAEDMARSNDPEEKKYGEEGRAKENFAVNAIFLSWGGEAVPETHAGVKIFQFSSGIYKGTAKAELGGLLRLSREFDFTHPVTGCPVEVCKNVDGQNKQTDTSYVVALAKRNETFRGAKIQVPDSSPIGGVEDEAAIDAILDQRKAMDFLLRLNTPDEMALRLAGVNPREERAGSRQLSAESIDKENW